MVQKNEGMQFMDGDFWRDQVLNDLMPYWFNNVRDEEHGTFYLNLSRQWKPTPPWNNIPAMISRQIFSFSTAYMLSGEEKYIETARKAAAYLLEHGWDKKYGGWFGSISQTGEPKDTVKAAPAQLYSNVGLTQYYMVTGDEQALSHVLKSVEIHKTKAHDKEFDGYYVSLNRDLSVHNFTKTKHSLYGQGSLLPNLFLTTRNADVLRFSEHLADLSIDRMLEPDTGWMLGYPTAFDAEWNYTPNIVDGKEAIYLGASSTAALFFLRLYHANGKDKYLKAGKLLGDNLCKYGWDAERGGWHTLAEKSLPHHPFPDQKVWWWIQIYGAFLQLQLYRVTREEKYLDRFRKTELFYDRYFMDHEYGGVFLGVTPEGSLVGEGQKAEAWQTSYHEIEHGFLNYLYLNLYVNKRPVVLHFKLDGPKKHFVSPVDDPLVRISGVRINGKPWTNFDAQERSITLPDGKDLKVEVTLVL